MILGWNASGILPPIRPGAQGHSSDRSPYLVCMKDIVENFSFSEKRQAILRGLLNYREALYQVGITHGFQWINGSFTENVEILENRTPNDIDVVTFCFLPESMNQDEAFKRFGSLFDPEKTKQSYLFQLGQPLESRHARQISYWSSMWSHRRDGTWKGFLEVHLSKTEDALASEILGLRGLS